MKVKSVSYNKNADLQAVFRPAQPYLERLDAFLRNYLDAFPLELRDYVAYVLSNKGKRVRPLLVFLSGMLGKREEYLVKAAAIVELIHIATLVHDDVIDEAQLRHSNLTAGAKYSPKEAILLGDSLFSHGLVLASQFSDPIICRAVAQATCRVCSGEIKQTLKYRLNQEYTLEDYFRVVELKTSELFYLACFLGAVVGGGDRNYINAVETYAKHLGYAYQIYDDMLDFYGSQESEGKTLGTDFSTDKMTLPLILLSNEIGSLKGIDEQDAKDKMSEHNIISMARNHFD
jgi:octaprenyl-diphosphate synthase